MASEDLLVEVKDFVGTLTFNRPERRNALSAECLIQFHLILEEWAKGTDVRCVVITGGEGKAFCSGFDITAIPTDVTPEMDELIKTHNPIELAFSSLKNFPYPTIAAWNGYCFGAGLNLSVCCDIRISVDDTKFGMPPAKLGLVYHPEGLQQFLDALGMSVTRELFMTAGTFTSVQAKEMGIVSHLYPRESFFDESNIPSQQITGNPPISLRNKKKILNMMEGAIGLSPEQTAEAGVLQAEGFTSEDLKEGQMAFIEKRKPVFKGK